MIHINTGRLFFYIVALISFSIAFIEGYSLLIMRGKVVTVEGTIVDVKTVLPVAYKQSNSKLAAFLYYIDGKKYLSENFIQVPMSAKIGDTKSIKVIIDQPHKLYSGSFAKFIIMLSVFILSLLIGIFLK